MGIDDSQRSDSVSHPLWELLRGPYGVSLAVLLVVNLIPLVGVLAWDWDVASVMILYWSENIVIGFYTLVKMLAKSPLAFPFMGLFFLIHYGGFCAVHGLLVLGLTTEEMPPILEGSTWPFFLIFVQLLFNVIAAVLAMAPDAWLLGFAGLFASHGVSLVKNYFLGGEYRDQEVRDLMSAPYKRIIVLHIAILAGGFGVIALGSPLPLLLALVALKIALDVWLHLGERRKQSPS